MKKGSTYVLPNFFFVAKLAADKQDRIIRIEFELPNTHVYP